MWDRKTEGSIEGGWVRESRRERDRGGGGGGRGVV